MTYKQIYKISEKLKEVLYNISGDIIDSEDAVDDEELDEFYISYTIDLRKFDKHLDKCYNKLEKLFVGYTCVKYERIEEIENSYLCINVLLNKKEK